MTATALRALENHEKDFTMPRIAPLGCLALALASALVFVSPASAASIQDYLVLGDSMAFGETDFSQNPSYGDRGYVKPFADFLATQNHTQRPQVINLGVDGETTSTFFNGGTRVVDPAVLGGKSATQLNLNYPDATTTQNSLLQSTIAAEQAAGHAITTVSVQLGANDLLGVVTQPGFFALTPQDQQTQIGQAINNILANDTTLMTELKTLLPQANILMLGYHNPFNADPNSPMGKVADPAIKALNTLIAAQAAAFGAKYVDTYTPFLGHELSYTYIASGNVHPNDAGYQLIANQMIQQVPEPSTALLFGAGLAGALGFGRRARRRIA
jgi:lysophospholipase L1-like esterase